MAGESDVEQLSTIFRALGTPTELDWPVSYSLSLFLLLPCFFRGTDNSFDTRIGT